VCDLENLNEEAMTRIGSQHHKKKKKKKNPQLKGYSTYWTKNNLLHHCVTDKDWYIQVVTLYTQQNLKYILAVKEKRNVNACNVNVI